MTTIATIALLDWERISHDLHNDGYALVENVLSAADCAGLINSYDNDLLYRKTIVMERYGYGLGQYRYFSYPLPPLVQQLREGIYPHLAPVANKWMEVLNIDKHFPPDLEGLIQLCHNHQQIKPTALVLKYAEGGYNALHQDLYGEVFFPMQAVVFLDEPGVDYTGGEFVLIEQKPRAQSKAIVLTPGKGDLLLFTNNFRPVKGVKGYYRVNMKHGVSEVTQGNRHTLGIIFHDAL